MYACSTLLVVGAVFLGFKVHADQGVRHGVISTSKVSVMSGPGLDYTTAFSLHEGAEVQIDADRLQ